jgi:hypothetical protein
MEFRTGPILPRFGRRLSAEVARERYRSWRARHRRLRLVFFLTLALVLLFAWLTNVEKGKEGTWERSGTLTRSDQAFTHKRGTFDAWTVDLASGQALRVEMRSAAFNPYFYIQGPLERETQEIVAESAAHSPEVAQGQFSAVATGEYLVVVPSRGEGALGTYALTSNYRLTDALSSQSDEIEGTAAVLLMLLVTLWLVQLLGVPIFLLWRHPDRILLLRPFGQQRISRSLKKLNRRTLAYRGFTFTLADKHLKDSLLLYLMSHLPADFGSLATLVYRPLFRRMHRYVFVRKPRDLDLVRLRLRSRWRLTALWQSWLGLSDRINKFRSRDELWKDCISILLDNCQVVLIDMSHAGQGTTWELEEVFRRSYLYKTVFLVRDDADERRIARELIDLIAAEHKLTGKTIPTLHRYATHDGRLADESAFEHAYAEAVSHEQQPVPARLAISPKAVLALAPMALLGPFWTPIGLPLGVLALRDIRRSHGMLMGEVVAHMAIVIHGVVISLIVLFAGIALFHR